MAVRIRFLFALTSVLLGLYHGCVQTFAPACYDVQCIALQKQGCPAQRFTHDIDRGVNLTMAIEVEVEQLLGNRRITGSISATPRVVK